MSSSDAPPPVDRWVTRSARPNCVQGRRRVAAADDRRRAGRARHGLGHRARAGRERLELEGAHRAVPEHGAGAGDLLAVGRGGARADVEAHPAVGHVDAVELAALGVGVEGLAEDEVDGQAQLRRCRARAARAPGSRSSSAHSESPIEWPCTDRNGKAIAPPMRIASARCRKASSTPILSVTLAPPTIATSGRAGSSRMPVSVSHLALQEQARGARQQVRDALGRGVRAVRRAEGVVDVDVRERRPGAAASSGSFFVSPGSKRMFSSMTTSPSGTWSRSGASCTSVLEQLAQARGHRARARAPRRGPWGARGARSAAGARRARAAARSSAARRGCGCRR